VARNVHGRGQQMGFGPQVTPPIIKKLLIANGIVYILQQVSPAVTMLGTVSPAQVWLNFEFWRPFSYMWLHSPGSPFHILFNLFALWMFGSQLALVWGEQRFLRYYMACGVGAGFLIASVPFVPVLLGFTPLTNEFLIPTLGASGAVMGVVLAYSLTWPDRTIMLIFPPMPIKAIWIIPLILGMELMSGPSNVSHLGHLGGVLVGWYYLVREGRTPGIPTLDSVKHKYRRYQMKKKIRSVHQENQREQKRWKDDDHDNPRFH
jgi:membrane associated rhomboid family serine protease